MPVEAPKPTRNTGASSTKIEVAVADPPLTDLYGGTFNPTEKIPGLKPAGTASQAEPKKGVVAPMVFDEKGGDQD